jgi:hypothetical protein
VDCRIAFMARLLLCDVRLKWNATLLTLFLQFDSFPKFFIGTASIFQVNR